MELWPILKYVLVAIVVVVVVAGTLLARSRRRKRLMAWAESRGFWFEEKDHSLASQFSGFEPFDTGKDRQAWHVMKGQVDGVAVLLFQYQYTSGSGKENTTVVNNVCVLRTGPDSPGLTLRKERMHHKLFDAVGGEDIDFESDEFSRKFWVRGPNRKFVYDVIHPRMMEYLMPLDKYLWQWKGQNLMLVRGGRLEPDRAEELVRDGMGLISLLPRHLNPSPS